MEKVDAKKVSLAHLVDKRDFGGILMFLTFSLLNWLYQIFGKEKDGWRRTTEANHRLEAARYLGSVGDLRLEEDFAPGKLEYQHAVIVRLHKALAKARFSRYALRWNRQAARLIPWEPIDFCYAIYDSFGLLIDLKFFPDPQWPLPKEYNSAHNQRAVDLLKAAFNDTLKSEERKRPVFLRQSYLNALKRDGTPNEVYGELFDRISSSSWFTFTSFENRDERFIPWSLTHYSNPGNNILDFELRHQNGTPQFDLWIKISHIALDGRFGNKLAKIVRRVFKNGSFVPRPFEADVPFFEKKSANPTAYHGGGILDFSTVINENEAWKNKGVTAHLTTVLAWKLGKHPFFKGKKVNIPVNIPKNRDQPASLGFVFVRPSQLRSKCREFTTFNRLLTNQEKAIINRYGPGLGIVQAAVIIPHWLNNWINSSFLSRWIQQVTGQLSFTLLHDVEIIFPTLSDNIQEAFAISLPRKSAVGFVGIRSATNNVSEIYTALKEALEDSEPRLVY